MSSFKNFIIEKAIKVKGKETSIMTKIWSSSCGHIEKVVSVVKKVLHIRGTVCLV